MAVTNAAVTGAQAVADAVSKVADAAVREIQKMPEGKLPEFVVTGTAGRIVIRPVGSTLFGAGGTLTLNGHPLQVLGWGGTRIEAKLPAGGPTSGELVIHIDSETKKSGFIRG